MDHSITPHVFQRDQRDQRQQQRQMYPDREQQAVDPDDRAQHRRAQQQPFRHHLSWREDGTTAPTQIHSRPRDEVKRPHLPVRSSNSEWTLRSEELHAFRPRRFDELSLRGRRHSEHQYQEEEEQQAVRDDAMSTAADRCPRHYTTIQDSYERDSGTRSPRRWQHDAASPHGVMGMSELTDCPGTTASKTALGFIMNQGELPSARFDWVDSGYSPNGFRNHHSQRRRSSLRIIPRVGIHQAEDDDEEKEEEEKRSVYYESQDAASYSSTHNQRHRSGPPAPGRTTESTVNTRTASRAFVEVTDPPPLAAAAEIAATMTHERPEVTAGKARARPRVRPAPSGTSQQKRRARECKIDGCPNYIINRGLCFRHGVRRFYHQLARLLAMTLTIHMLLHNPLCGQGGKKCSEDGCTKSAKHADKCWKHGGSVKCLVETCTRKGKSRGFCWAHGGGTKCSDASCSKVAVSNGFCWAHGGGKRCMLEGCEKAAYKRTHNYCVAHHELLKDGNVTLEV